MACRGWIALLWLSGCLTIPGPPVTGSDAGVDGTSGHDEDGDGMLDGADRCPHLAAIQADNDQDGFGNDCDVDPETGGEVVQFFAFDDPADLAAFTKIGQVVQGDDVAEIGALVGDSAAQLSFPYAEFLIDTEVDFIELGASNFRGIGVQSGYTDAGSFDKCFFGQYPPDGTDVIAGIDQSGANVGDAMFAGVMLVDVERLHIRITRTVAEGYHCTVGPPAGVVLTPTQPLTELGPMVGLFAENAIVQFRYFYLAARP